MLAAIVYICDSNREWVAVSLLCCGMIHPANIMPRHRPCNNRRTYINRHQVATALGGWLEDAGYAMPWLVLVASPLPAGVSPRRLDAVRVIDNARAGWLLAVDLLADVVNIWSERM